MATIHRACVWWLWLFVWHIITRVLVLLAVVSLRIKQAPQWIAEKNIPTSSFVECPFSDIQNPDLWIWVGLFIVLIESERSATSLECDELWKHEIIVYAKNKQPAVNQNELRNIFDSLKMCDNGSHMQTLCLLAPLLFNSPFRSESTIEIIMTLATAKKVEIVKIWLWII